MAREQPPSRGPQPDPAEGDEVEAHLRARRELGIRALDADEELIDRETFGRLQAQLTVAGTAAGSADELLLEEVATELPPDSPRDESCGDPIEPVSGPGHMAEAETALLDASDRDGVCRAALGIARAYAPAAALLVVSRVAIAGLRGSGGGLEGRCQGIAISRETPSLFADCAARREIFRGPPPRGGLDAQLLRAMGRGGAAEIAVLPISIQGRAANLLYADGDDAPLGRTSVAALESLTTLVAQAYERLIRARKHARRRTP